MVIIKHVKWRSMHKYNEVGGVRVAPKIFKVLLQRGKRNIVAAQTKPYQNDHN